MHGAGSPDGLDQPLDAVPAWNESKSRLRKSDPCTLRRNPEVAGQRKLHPAPQRIAIDRGDHRQRTGLKLIEKYPRPSEGALKQLCAVDGLVGLEISTRTEEAI